MKSTTSTVAAAAMVIFVQSAEAREHHHGRRHHHSLVASRGTLCRGAVNTKRTVRLCGRKPRVKHDSVSGARPGASGCVVRLGDAAPRGRRSGAAPCREDRWSAKRRVGYRIRQRRSYASRPPSIDRGSDCDQAGLIALVVSIFPKQRAAPTMGGPFFKKSSSSYSPAAKRGLLFRTILSASYSTPARPIGT